MAGLSLALLGACANTPSTPSSSSALSATTASSSPTVTESAQPVTPQSQTPASTAATPSAQADRLAAAPSATAATYKFPIVGNSSYARVHHDYPATDLMTDCGNKFVAVTTGTVLNVNTKDVWKRSVDAGATRGGLSVAIRGDDGVRYYGSHLSKIAAGIKIGARVTAGQTLGLTGKTGDASACHVHFGISPPCAGQGDWWLQRGTVWPWPFLDAWRKGVNKSAVATVKTWLTKNGCSKKAPAGA